MPLQLKLYVKMNQVCVLGEQFGRAGGAPAQCEPISSYIRSKADKHKVPVLAFANDIAASGGYWLMCAADELYACRTSLVGSIGVVGNSFGFVDVLKRVGVERRIAVAGALHLASSKGRYVFLCFHL